MKRAGNGTTGATISMTLSPQIVDGINVAARMCGMNRSFWSSVVLTGNRTQG